MVSVRRLIEGGTMRMASLINARRFILSRRGGSSRAKTAVCVGTSGTSTLRSVGGGLGIRVGAL